MSEEPRGAGRVRQRRGHPVADPARPTYDRATGRVSAVTPPPDGSSGAAPPPPLVPHRRVAPADGDDETSSGDGGDGPRLFRAPADQDIAASQARRAYRRTKVRHWSENYPLRMRRWIEHSMHDIATRIYCEVAVRVPMARIGKDEVLGLVEPYGVVEYVQCLDRVAAMRPPKPTSAADKDAADSRARGVDPLTSLIVGSGSVDSGHTHVVRFREGLDAVRCFLELNGSCIDPSRYNAAVEQVSSLVNAAPDNDAGDGTADAAAAEDEQAAAADRARAELIESLSIANATVGADPQDLIFVTVDFFRTAFAGPAPCGGTPARSSLPITASKGPRFAVKPTGETPVAWLARRLAQQAAEAAHWYPIVVSHAPLTWEQFCTGANLTAFTIVTPTPNNFYATTLPRNLDPLTQDEVRSRRWEPSHWSVALEALPRAHYDGDDLLRLVDVSSGPDELMRGLHHKLTWHSAMVHRIHAWLNRSPLVVGVVVLLLVCVIIAGTVVLFRQQQHTPVR